MKILYLQYIYYNTIQYNSAYKSQQSPLLYQKWQLEVQIIGILEEVDSFYWPKLHLWKGAQKLGWPPPPTPFIWTKSIKTAVFFRETFPKWLDSTASQPYLTRGPRANAYTSKKSMGGNGWNLSFDQGITELVRNGSFKRCIICRV